MPASQVRNVVRGQKALTKSSGIGKSVAIGFAEARADVVVNYVTNRAAGEAVVDEIRSVGVEPFADKQT